MACILTSLAYAEFASRIPGSGSAFTYVYVAFGEFFAWLVGWNLILGYGFTASVAARAWGDYAGNFLVKVVPSGRCRIVMEGFTELSLFGSSVNYTCSPLSMVIVGLSTAVLLRGAKDSSRFNNIMTITNISILLLVIVSSIATESVAADNLTPFAPHGLPGVLQGAGLVFFAFIGFDMVASLSEEVVNPERNLPIGIVGSLIVSTLIYVSVSLAVVGMAPFRYLGETIPIVNAVLVNACCTHAEQVEAHKVSECLLDCPAFERPMLRVVGNIVSGGAMFGLMASCFTSLMGQPRIFYRMAQDGLWFHLFAEIDPETQVPTSGIKLTGIVCALLACFVPLEALANLISLGTLMVFTFVDAGVILLRVRNVSEASVGAMHHLQDKEDGKRLFTRVHGNIVCLLILFTGSLLAAAIVLSVTENKYLVYTLIAVAAIAGALIGYLPDSWTVTPDHVVHGHTAKFSCPWVPVVPLGGVACNSFMMGSLPLFSWLLCAIWLACGIAVYFSYGIHNSKLGQKSRYSETVPLIEYGATGQEGGYESTLNKNIRKIRTENK
jgi:APA family basic amino acid/polyamine antiporter